MTLSAFQLSYNGLTFGAGQDVQLASADGLREAPSTRGSDVLKPRMHGAFAGKTYFGERIVHLTLAVSTTVAAFETVLAGVSAAFANITEPTGLLPLQFLLPSWATPRQVVGRVTKGGYPVDTNYQFHKLAAIPVEITCPDPLITDTATQTFTVSLPTPSAGGTFPATFNYTFGTQAGTFFTLANAGNEAMWPVFTFTGPLTWPTLYWTGGTFTFELTLGAGDTLVVDTAASSAVLNGTGDRFNSIASGSTFPNVPPGGRQFQFASADAVAVAGTCGVTLPTGAWGWC